MEKTMLRIFTHGNALECKSITRIRPMAALPFPRVRIPVKCGFIRNQAHHKMDEVHVSG
jgi:hypothetical protein